MNTQNIIVYRSSTEEAFNEALYSLLVNHPVGIIIGCLSFIAFCVFCSWFKYAGYKKFFNN